MDIDSLRHAKGEEKPVENYKGDYKELKTMQGMMKGRTPEIEQSVRNHDEKVAYAVEHVL